MSSQSFASINQARPDLVHASEVIGHWLVQNSHRDFLDTHAIIRDLGDELTPDEIVEFFRAIREAGIAKVGYMIKDPEGYFTGGVYQSLDNIPQFDFDRFGTNFQVDPANVVQIYRLGEASKDA